MFRYKNIINKVSNMNKDEIYQQAIQKKWAVAADRYLYRMETEKNKSETEKQHERYVHKLHKGVYEVDLEVRAARAEVKKPGTYFYGTLRKLAEDFEGDIKIMTRYMTIGQNSKYQEKDGVLWNIKTGKMAFNPTTKEVFE